MLPKILEIVKECKDHIAQRYLMEIIIQVFPDDYHLDTLEDYLQTCTQLREKVDVKSILVTLMDRIAGYFRDEQTSGQADPRAFTMLNEYVAKVVQGQPNMDVNDILSLQVALVNFAINCYPGKHEYVDLVLNFCVQVLSKTVDEHSRKVDEAGVPFVTDLLIIPLEKYSLDVLRLEHYPSLMAFLGWEHRKRVSVQLVTAVLESKTSPACLTSPELVDRLFSFIAPLIKVRGIIMYSCRPLWSYFSLKLHSCCRSLILAAVVPFVKLPLFTSGSRSNILGPTPAHVLLNTFLTLIAFPHQRTRTIRRRTMMICPRAPMRRRSSSASSTLSRAWCT